MVKIQGHAGWIVLVIIVELVKSGIRGACRQCSVGMCCLIFFFFLNCVRFFLFFFFFFMCVCMCVCVCVCVCVYVCVEQSLLELDLPCFREDQRGLPQPRILEDGLGRNKIRNQIPSLYFCLSVASILWLEAWRAALRVVVDQFWTCHWLPFRKHVALHTV
jgi:hypothetical protein